MAKLIVHFMTVVLELAAILFVIGGGVAGLGYSINEDNLDIASAFITVPLGVAGGFIVATIVLGIPLLILRINQNLEDISETLDEINETLGKDNPIPQASLNKD
jgi:ABC-type sulfate transport system permease component